MGANRFGLLAIALIKVLVLTSCLGQLIGVNYVIPGFTLPAESHVVKCKSTNADTQSLHVRSNLGYQAFGDEMDQIMHNLGFTRDPKSMQPWEQGYSVTYWKESENQKLVLNYVPNPPKGKGPKNLHKNWEYQITLVGNVESIPDRSE